MFFVKLKDNLLVKIFRVLRKLQVHYNINKGLSMNRILIQLNPFHPLAPYFSKIRFNNVLPAIPISRK